MFKSRSDSERGAGSPEDKGGEGGGLTDPCCSSEDDDVSGTGSGEGGLRSVDFLVFFLVLPLPLTTLACSSAEDSIQRRWRRRDEAAGSVKPALLRHELKCSRLDTSRCSRGSDRNNVQVTSEEAVAVEVVLLIRRKRIR